MANPNDPNLIRLSIIDSLFTPGRVSSGQTGQAYIAHCKTSEEVPGQPGERKPRYILLAVANTAKVFLHKSKRNNNGTFSIGKTWDLTELRALELAGPTAFKITMGARSYVWETDSASERIHFLTKLVRCYRQYTSGGMPTLGGFSVDASSSSTPAYTVPPATTAPTAASLPPTRPLNLPSRGAPPPSTQARPAAANAVVPPRPSTADSAATSATVSRDAPNGVLPRRPMNAPPVVRKASGGPAPASMVRNVSGGSGGPSSLGANGAVRRPSIPQIQLPSGPTTGKSSPSRGPLSASSDGPSRSRLPIGDPLRTVGATTPTPSESRSGRTTPAPGAESSNATTPASRIKGLPRDDEEEPVPLQPQSSGAVDIPDPHDILDNVEEMLEGYEWRTVGSSIGMSSKSTIGLGMSGATGLGLGGGGAAADQIEARLLGELQALEAAEIHAIIAQDDRTATIVKHLDEALAELERMDLMLSLYKTQLNGVTDDIEHIEGQNRGLQVQTSNQRALLREIEQLLQTIHIPQDDIDALAKEPLDSDKGISRLEEAASSLYKALLSMNEGNVAAAAEREVDYRRDVGSFGKRLYEFLLVMFKYQADLVANDKANAITSSHPKIPSHANLEKYLERYCGLTLFVKEMDDSKYQQLCAAYFTTISGLHKQEITQLLAVLKAQVRKATEEELDASFATVTNSPTGRAGTVRRAAGNVRSPLLDRKDRDADKTLSGGDAFRRALGQIAPHIIAEQQFVSDFLHLHPPDLSITFADYAMLEGYFKRSAMTQAAKNADRQKDAGQAMDMIFGWLAGEIKTWVEWMLNKDQMQIVGILAALDVTLLEAEAARNEFLVKILQSQYRRCSTVFERQVKDQLKAIEQTKLTVKKRKGVVPFIRIFPDFVQRIEAQLVHVEEDAEVRHMVDGVYERTVGAMFDALQTMARSDEAAGPLSQEDRDKDRLNYHTLIIENMHHFLTTVSKLKVAGLNEALDRARRKYDENLNLYIRLVLRRPLAKLIDYFQGIEDLLRTTPPSEVSLHSQFTKSALKRVVSSLDRKDLRKSVEALSKRVEKHFIDITNPSAENAVVVGNVWNACEAEVGRLAALWKGLLERCYEKEGVVLDFGAEDVSGAFGKYKPGQ